jgi:ribose 5-phosphate isomerase B
MTMSEEEVRGMVRRIVLRTLGQEGTSAKAPRADVPRAEPPRRPAEGQARPTVTEADVRALPLGGKLNVPSTALVTPLAEDAARDRRVELVRDPARSLAGGSSLQASPAAAPAATVALGADHGGFPLKEELKAYLGELGYQAIDCGTQGTAAVDYPDFAYAVATLVAEGRAWRGIVVDGAGIGSCMAANKVPGVRASMCYDHATAVNSREHNDANVLTLGGSLIGPNLARQIVKAWLETAFGGGRHARRVEKIMAIERRFLHR